MNATTGTPDFPAETAAWIREHVWDSWMRDAYEWRWGGWFPRECACRQPPTYECRSGNHVECPPPYVGPVRETAIGVYGCLPICQFEEPYLHITWPHTTPIRDAMVWLADRQCRHLRCRCDCHDHGNAAPGAQASLF